MAAGDYSLKVLSIFALVLKRPAAAPRNPDPVELRLFEQAKHLLEIATINVGQDILFLSVELGTPPCSLRLPGAG